MKEFVNKLIGRLEECVEWDGYTLDIRDKMLKIVNELEEECNNDCCEWKFMKTVVAYFYSSGCNHKRFSDLHGFEFCPYCGKKIKVVK